MSEHTKIDHLCTNLMQVRLYFMDDKNVLQELCQDNGSLTWTYGALGTAGITAMSGSSLTAHINIERDTKGKAITRKQLKVYYWTSSSDTKPSVAWYTLGETGQKWQKKGSNFF